jgi:hypothetical protein
VDIWSYFQDRERELRECSLYVPAHINLFRAEPGDQRGKVYGPVHFDGFQETAALCINEEIVVKGSGITRPRYAYFLVIEGHEIGGFERHSTHDPAVHRHCSGQKHHEPSPWRVMSFKEAAAEAWKYVSELAEPLTK